MRETDKHREWGKEIATDEKRRINTGQTNEGTRVELGEWIEVTSHPKVKDCGVKDGRWSVQQGGVNPLGR